MSLREVLELLLMSSWQEEWLDRVTVARQSWKLGVVGSQEVLGFPEILRANTGSSTAIGILSLTEL